MPFWMEWKGRIWPEELMLDCDILSLYSRSRWLYICVCTVYICTNYGTTSKIAIEHTFHKLFAPQLRHYVSYSAEWTMRNARIYLETDDDLKPHFGNAKSDYTQFYSHSKIQCFSLLSDDSMTANIFQSSLNMIDFNIQLSAMFNFVCLWTLHSFK